MGYIRGNRLGLTGKTVFEKYILGTISLEIPEAQATICDFKGEDFKDLEGCKRYYTFTECESGFDRFYREVFQQRQHGYCNNRDLRLIVFDEWASYLNYIVGSSTVDGLTGAKRAEIERQKMATLLMLGRAYSCNVILCQQVFYAKQLEGAKENLSLVVNFGNMSKIVAGMWEFDNEQLLPAQAAGAGHILRNRVEQTAFQAPIVTDFVKLDKAIRRLVE